MLVVAILAIATLLVLLHLLLLLLLVAALEGQPLDNIVGSARESYRLATSARGECLDDVGNFKLFAVWDGSCLHLDFFDVAKVKIQVVHSNDAVATLNAI